MTTSADHWSMIAADCKKTWMTEINTNPHWNNPQDSEWDVPRPEANNKQKNQHMNTEN